MTSIRNVIICCASVFAFSACAQLGSAVFGQPEPMETPASAPPAVSAEHYRLETGDVISVRVYGGEEDLRLERVRLDTSGKIIMPFGDFTARGRTTTELEAAITDSVRGRIYTNPRVWVSVEEFRPFFVDGQVSKPGAYPYQPGLTVRRAVTIAGGFRERAAPDKIFLLREKDVSNRQVRVRLDAPVGPGDTVTVQESFF